MDIHHIRENYTQSTLSIDDVTKNPTDQFKKWLDEAIKSEVNEPTAMTLATVDKTGQPNARVVLLKYIDEDGFTFFTNYDSNKGINLAQNPKAGIVFFWPELQRQVNIQGIVSKTSNKVSDEYFYSRPLESQIGACASPQSSPIPSREILEKNIQSIQESGKEIVRPIHWGGYSLNPTRIEFWQGRASRLHDRIVYTKTGNSWKMERLAP